MNAIVKALQNLVARCDGAEGVRADGSNIDTSEAHAALSSVVCAWCNNDIGTTTAPATSHGICDTCAEAMLKEDES
jgi:hypothetical protein